MDKSPKPTGSTTNASDAVDDIEDLDQDSTTDDVLDEGLQETFPASDPVAIGTAHKKRKKKAP